MNVLMPQLGETVTEGKINAWHKRVGDMVAPGDDLFEIETDKASMDVPATSGGVLAEIRVAQGDAAPVGSIVAVIDAPEAGRGAMEPRASAMTGAPSETSPSFPRQRRTLELFAEVRSPDRNWGPARVGDAFATPLARRLAGQRNLNLIDLKGSGPRGRIMARDIEAIGARPGSGPPAEKGSDILALYRDRAFEARPVGRMRGALASRLTLAKQTIPHFYLTIDIDARNIVRTRKEFEGLLSSKSGELRISVTDFIVKALALALKRVPEANVVWAGDQILYFSQSDIAVAVSVDGGLLTPIVRAADAKSLGVISREMHELAARARSQKLMPEQYRGGSCTISNLGMHGVREFSAIINPPQSIILAVGAIRRAPIETNEGVLFIDQMTITMSCDHRVLDGVTGASLLRILKDYLEQPSTMLV